MIRLYNAKLLMPDMSIQSGEISIEKNIIKYIGKPETPQEYEKEIDLGGNLLMPGFKNLHTHSPMTFLRSYAEDLPLDRWLNEKIFPAEAKMTDEDAYWCTMLAFAEYLTSGMTACFDMYFFPEAVAKASVDMGFRTTILSSLNNFKESIPEIEENYHKYNSYDPLVGFIPGFHAEYTTSRELLEGMAELSHRLNTPLGAHMSETRSEVEECKKRYGLTPTALFEKLGILDIDGGIFAHCVWLDDNDIKIMKKHNCTAVINSGSNCKLASGTAPFVTLCEAGVNTALGTDGPASNNCLDMFREMWLATALQKLKTENAAAMPAHTVLKAATQNGAKALGINALGISEGALADLIVIDLKRPNMQPENNIVQNLVYSGSKENVLMTMIDGKILYEREKGFLNCDIDEIYKKVSQISQRILN